MFRTHPSRRFISRSTLGLLLSAPLAGIILAMSACLPVPVGDPAQSKADAAVNGVWLWTQENDDRLLFVARPWDERTHLVQVYEYDETNGAIRPEAFYLYKAWFSTIADARFITLEPVLKFGSDGFETGEDENMWIVGEFSMQGDAVLINPIGGDRFKGVQSREQAERIIRESRAAGVTQGYYVGDQAITLNRQTGAPGVQLLDRVRSSFRGPTKTN